MTLLLVLNILTLTNIFNLMDFTNCVYGNWVYGLFPMVV